MSCTGNWIEDDRWSLMMVTPGHSSIWHWPRGGSAIWAKLPDVKLLTISGCNFVQVCTRYTSTRVAGTSHFDDSRVDRQVESGFYAHNDFERVSVIFTIAPHLASIASEAGKCGRILWNSPTCLALGPLAVYPCIPKRRPNLVCGWDISELM